MHKRVRYRRIHLYPYDLIGTPLWTLPPVSPSPTPLAIIVHAPRSPYRKITLTTFAENTPPSIDTFSVENSLLPPAI